MNDCLALGINHYSVYGVEVLIGTHPRNNDASRRIPIIASEEVDPEFGTGALKITPGHDPTDYAIGQQFGLEIINIMNDDGSLNANAAAYQGMERFKARKAIWADLKVGPNLDAPLECQGSSLLTINDGGRSPRLVAELFTYMFVPYLMLVTSVDGVII